METEVTTTEPTVPDSNPSKETTEESDQTNQPIDSHGSIAKDRYNKIDSRRKDHDRNYFRGAKGENYNRGRNVNRWPIGPSGGRFPGGPQMRGPFMGVPQFAPPHGFGMGLIPDMNSMMQFPQVMQGMMGPHNMNMHMVHPTMPNMMDQSMMIMNQNLVQSTNQPILLSSSTLLPPIPGVQTPQRKERPNGCRTIFIGGLPTISTENLQEIFSRFGSICEIKSPRSGLYYVRFEREESVDFSFILTGYRFKFFNQSDNEATTMFIDYALNRKDQEEYEMQFHKMSPPAEEAFTPSALSSVSEMIKSDSEFVVGGTTLASWLERGECTKQFANTFYSLIQSSNNQLRRLFNEKMRLDDKLLNMKASIKDNFSDVVKQFELVARILSAAKKQRAYDHFSKQQRRNIDMWLKMTEDVENIKEEFYTNFDDQDVDLKLGKNMVPLDKYEQLKKDNESLSCELEEYKNKAHLAKDEAERKFEKFKAHYIAQQALQNQIFPPQPSSTTINPPNVMAQLTELPSASEAMLISILTAFLLVHPLGASIDYLVSYVSSMLPDTSETALLSTLQKYKNIFNCSTRGFGASMESKWTFISFDTIKNSKNDI